MGVTASSGPLPASASAGVRTHRGEAKLARVALAGHALLLVFSGIAFATFLAPPAPAWLMTPISAARRATSVR